MAMSFVLGTVLTTLAIVAVPLHPGDQYWVATLIAWIVFTLAHITITAGHYAGRAGERLSSALAQDRGERGRWGRVLRVRGMRSVLSGGDAPSFAAQVALMALAAVSLLLLNERLRAQPLMLIVAGVLVLSSWFNMLVAYAVHYARLDHAEPALTFPDREERAFGDYMYVATSVQTTFGVTDLSVRTRTMRRAIVAHSLIAFVFNTVIIAMLVATLMTVIGDA